MLFVLLIGYVCICYAMESCEVADENTAKRVYVSSGNTPGKPDRKTRRLSHNATSSRALFPSPGTSPKVIALCTFTVNQ